MTTEETPEVEPTMPAVMEESTAPMVEEPTSAPAPSILEETPPPPPMPPPPAQPEAEQGVSDGTLICTVCLRTVSRGEKYVRTLVRGINHLDPCSHRS